MIKGLLKIKRFISLEEVFNLERLIKNAERSNQTLVLYGAVEYVPFKKDKTKRSGKRFKRTYR